MTLEVRVVNGAAVDAMVRGIAADLEHLADPLAKALGVALTTAAATAPVATGRLAGSHTLTAAPPASARLVNRAPYARYVHDGTRYVRPRPWMASALTSTTPRWVAALTDTVQRELDARARVTR